MRKLVAVVWAFLRALLEIFSVPRGGQQHTAYPLGASVLETIANVAALIAGLFLFLVGLLGITELGVESSSLVTVMLEPMNRGKKMDEIFFVALMVFGLLLTLGLFARLTASLALILVASKIALARGYVNMFAMLVTALAAAAAIVLVLKWRENRRR